jgi:hypothetical protein
VHNAFFQLKSNTFPSTYPYLSSRPARGRYWEKRCVKLPSFQKSGDDRQSNSGSKLIDRPELHRPGFFEDSVGPDLKNHRPIAEHHVEDIILKKMKSIISALLIMLINTLPCLGAELKPGKPGQIRGYYIFYETIEGEKEANICRIVIGKPDKSGPLKNEDVKITIFDRENKRIKFKSLNRAGPLVEAGGPSFSVTLRYQLSGAAIADIYQIKVGLFEDQSLIEFK